MASTPLISKCRGRERRVSEFEATPGLYNETHVSGGKGDKARITKAKTVQITHTS